MHRFRTILSLATGSAALLIAGSVMAQARVIITEIMYNPASEERQGESEWVEIANVGDEPIDIRDWKLDDEDTQPWAQWGPFSCTLPPGAVAVLINREAVTEADFRKAWGLDKEQPDGREKCLVIPVKWGSLANNPTERNEILQLKDVEDKVICEVNFQSGNGWPTITGIGGPSIFLNDLAAKDLNDGTHWRKSQTGEGGAIKVAKVGIFGGEDIGSPGFVPGLKPGVAPAKPAAPPAEGKDRDNEIDY